ncbi:hypothetical protein GF356_05390 [candidate division GN15 bacterium]|nr:hypothetical protein [candidate division GN15 bacterium]
MVVGTIVLGAVALFVLVSAFSLHCHVLANGRIIVHSHPIDRTHGNDTSHDHSSQEFTLLKAAAFAFQAEEPDYAVVAHMNLRPLSSLKDRSQHAPVAYHGTQVSLRAPPECDFC